jgi:hypothetical protein
MNSPTWILALVFLAVSIPLVLLLQLLQLGGEFRLLIAIGAGVAAAGFAQSRLASRKDKQ